jgi:hypothetical protein
MPRLTAEQLGTLSALAAGIIPPDERDNGAAAVNAAPRIADKIAAGINAALYVQGSDLAESLSQKHYSKSVNALDARERHELLAAVRDSIPAFFKQLRMDVSALYLSDPAVWQRIGFPGPSTATGGYPDFDQPQSVRNR